MSPRKYLVLAKIETTQFTDPTPAAADNSILVKNLRLTPLKVFNEDRNLVRPYFGNSEQLVVGSEAMIEFDVEVAGSGTPGTAPAFGPLLRACAMAEVETEDVSVAYNPISEALESIYLKCFRDGLLYKFAGCRGNVKVLFDAKKLPHFSFSFLGKYVAVSDASIPGGADFTAFQLPVAAIPANAGTMTIGGYAAKLASLSADLANDVVHAIWINQETVNIEDRKPKGSILAQMVLVATKNYWAGVLAGTTQALVYTHGLVAGNIVTIAAPAMQIMDIAEAEFEKSLALQMNTIFAPDEGNDELTFTFT